MSAVSNIEYFRGVLTKKMGDESVAERVRYSMTICMLSVLTNIESVTSFLKVDQAHLCDDLYDEHYVSNFKLRMRQMPALSAIGVQIALKFYNNCSPVFELGAGEVDAEGKTLGMRVLPESYDVHPTEFNSKVVERSQKLNPKYTHLDMNRLKETKATQFFALNVIDTLTPNQFKTFIEALESLPEGSTIVHVNDMSPMVNAFAWDLISRNQLVFPDIDNGDLKGALVIDYSSVRSHLEKVLDPQEINFLDNAFKSFERNEQVFHHLLHDGASYIAQWLKKAIPSEFLKQVSLTDHYLAKLNAFSSLKLKTLFSSTLYESVIMDYSLSLMLGHNNWIHNDMGTLENRKCYVLHPSKVMISAKLIVFAIKRVNA